MKPRLSRRAFFSALASVPIAATLAIDPLAPTIFLPPRNGWPLLRRPVLTREMLQQHAGQIVETDVIWAPLYDYQPGTEHDITYFA